MTYQRSTLTLHSTAPDKIPQDAPKDAWNSVNNIFFRNGETLRARGDKPTLPGATEDAQTLVYVTIANDAGYWVYATNTGVYAHDGASEYDITPAAGWTGSETAVFTSCVLNGIAYVHATDRDPFYWDGGIASPCKPLPDWPVDGRCKALRPFKNFMFAIGMTSDPGSGQRVRWSDAASAGTVPGEWTPSASNLAGFVDLAPLSSPALEGSALRDSFLIYKGESIWQLDFVGGNDVFQVRQFSAEHGISNTNALTRGIDDVHVFISSEGDMMLTNGVDTTSILDGRAQNTFYKDFSQNRDAKFACATLARQKAVALGYPKAGSTKIDRAVIFDLSTGDIGIRELPDINCMASGSALADPGDANQWDGDPQAWDADLTVWTEEIQLATLDDVISGGAFGFSLLTDGETNDFLSGPVQAMAVKEGLSFGDPQAKKVVGRIWPKLSGENGTEVTFRLGAQDITGGPISLIPPVIYTIGQANPLDVLINARFLYMEVTSNGGAPWRLGSIDIEHKPAGLF